MNFLPTARRIQSGEGLSRRNFLRVGSLGLGGLMLGDLLRLRAEESAPRAKSIIMVLLIGGPSHIDMYDMKPDAPVEVRGEFSPIRTNVPGMDICEHMPRQARIADKLTIIRNMKFTGDNHSGEQLTTGWRSGKPLRPAGAIVATAEEDHAGAVPCAAQPTHGRRAGPETSSGPVRIRASRVHALTPIR